MSQTVESGGLSGLAREIEAARGELAPMLAAGEGGRTTTAAFTARVLDALRTVVAPVADALDGAAVVAVGALGRGELGPHSDLDLVLLVPDLAAVPHEELEAQMQRLVHPLWDAGLKVQASVQDPRGWMSAAAEELSVCTSLLDATLVVGSPAVLEDLASRARARFFGARRAAFLHRMQEEVEQRHVRYGGTVYRVEPDLKYGPGGLRDLAVVHWCLMAAHGTADLSQLVARGLVRPHLASRLEAARDTLLRLRAALHLGTGRASDRLAFQHQERMPAVLGLVVEGAGDDDDLVAAIEAFMQGYYRAAADVVRFGRRVCEACLPARDRPHTSRRVDERFRIVDGRLQADGDGIFSVAPVLALDALALARDHRVRLHGDTFDELAEVAGSPSARELATESAAHRRFFDLLTNPDDLGSPSALELCNELGLLELVIPELGPSRARMQHEGLHVYTVDQHSLAAVAFLKAVRRGDHRKEYPLATAMHLDLDDVRGLYLATLLHDVGKALGGDQCETGERVTREVATRLGLYGEDVERAAWLVRHHMDMPTLSQKRDLTDKLLLDEFVATVPDRGALRELYLVSLADMSQVRPGYLTGWKLALLDELYLRAAAALRAGGQLARTATGELPDRYYALFDADLRTRHFQLVDRVAAGRQPVAVALEQAPGGLRLTVVAVDRPGFLARVAAVVDDHGLEVLAADAFSVRRDAPVALDVFRVRAKSGADLPDGAALLAMEQALSGPGPREPLTPLPRLAGRSRRIPTDVAFESDPSGRQTIVEVQTADQPGVLRRITAAFADCGAEILLARCLSEADMVTDVFYVSRLTEAAQQTLTERLHEYLRRA